MEFSKLLSEILSNARLPSDMDKFEKQLDCFFDGLAVHDETEAQVPTKQTMQTKKLLKTQKEEDQ